MNSEILKPVAVLIAWTLVVLVWFMAKRIPAMKAAGINLNKLVGSKGTDADGVLPAKAQWPAHNYNHLMEQPTLFYAVALLLAIGGWGNGLNATIAWGYVALRIAHSIVQITFNRVAVRFVLFLLSSLCLIALAVHALIGVFALHG